MSPLSDGPLAGCELVVFDKDGTLIEFHAMWGGWTAALAADLEQAAAAIRPELGVPVAEALYRVMGVDPVTGLVDPHGALAATPMAVLRGMTETTLVRAGFSLAEAAAAVGAAWHPPDPVVLARPLADLAGLFAMLHRSGAKVAVATSDDREPTERTLAALGVAALIDASVCADDGIPVKPAPDMVLELCRRLGVAPGRTAMVGDSAIDLRMGRAAGVARCIGVLSGTGTRPELAPFADAIVGSIAEFLPGG